MEEPDAIDPRRSLLELEDPDWDPTRYDDAAQRLCAKPLRRLQPGELFCLIQQGCALRFTVPLAVDRLETDPLLAAAHHPGDLLVAVLEVPSAFWVDRAELWARAAAVVGEIAGRAQEAAEHAERPGYLPDVIGDDLMAAVLHFRGALLPESDGEFAD